MIILKLLLSFRQSLQYTDCIPFQKGKNNQTSPHLKKKSWP